MGELDDTVYATLKPSPIHGIGVFAIRDIPKGQRYTNHHLYDPFEAKATLFNKSDLDKCSPEIRSLILDHILFEKDMPNLFYSPNQHVALQSYMNHSDTPNTNGFKTTQDIKKGEELTENYNTVSNGELHDMTKEHHSGII